MKSQPINADLACQNAMDRLAKAGFESLTDREKTLATVWMIEAAVENAGFLKGLSGAAGDLAFHAPAAFAAIGASELAGLTARANALFGSDGPPRDRAAREVLIQSFPPETTETLDLLDRQFMESDEDTNELIEAYLTRA